MTATKLFLLIIVPLLIFSSLGIFGESLNVFTSSHTEAKAALLIILFVGLIISVVIGDFIPAVLSVVITITILYFNHSYQDYNYLDKTVQMKMS